jgi:hypothetical protein
VGRKKVEEEEILPVSVSLLADIGSVLSHKGMDKIPLIYS